MRLITVIALTCFAPAVTNAEESTPFRTISQLRFDALAGEVTIYFETPSGSWGLAGCPMPDTRMVRDVAGLKELLAIGLAAKLVERSVSFQGTCRDADHRAVIHRGRVLRLTLRQL